jgi:hypothetical protein
MLPYTPCIFVKTVPPAFIAPAATLTTSDGHATEIIILITKRKLECACEKVEWI